MGARAETAAATRERAIQAAYELFLERHFDEVTFPAVAARAGVSVPTIVRTFGTKEGMLAAVAAREAPERERIRAVDPGDYAAAVRAVVRDYEATGDAVMRAIVTAERYPGLADAIAQGRDAHKDWCARVFGPLLDGTPAVTREQALLRCVVATDVCTWHLLRRQHGLSAEETADVMLSTLGSLEGER